MLKTIISVLQYEVLCEQTWAASVRTALRTIHYMASVPAITWDLWDLDRRTHSLHATQCVSLQSDLSHENLHLLANHVKREKGTV